MNRLITAFKRIAAQIADREQFSKKVLDGRPSLKTVKQWIKSQYK